MMKKLTACLMILLLLVGAALAEPVLPQVGDIIAGFVVQDVQEYPLLQSDLVYFLHEKTGAQLLWVANDDTDRAFSVSFRTLDGSTKGTPHVFEHAALSGSVKYPDPTLFFSMVSSTCQTYLNASTYPHMTVYPCASLSEKQLLKFVDVYLSGVYEPLVLTDINAMRREAYRYELADKDADITLTGTVYSEMLGAYAQGEEYYKLMEAIYPGSVIATCTGGIPGVIETMTHQDLIDFHDKYYRPSNSAMVLYGDLDPAPFLTLIDEEYLVGCDDTPAEISDPDYTPFAGYAEETYEIAAGAEADADTTLYYAVRLPEMSLLEEELADLASIALGAESSPLTMAAQELWPECIFDASIEKEGPEPILVFQLNHAQSVTPTEFVSVIQEKTRELLAQGVDQDLLESTVAAIKKSQILGRESTGYGPELGMVVSRYFGFSGDIHSFMDVNREFYEQMDDYRQDGRLESLLSFICEFRDSKLVTMHTVPGLSEEREAAAAQRLIDMKASMSEQELDELISQTREFEAWSDAVQRTPMIDEVRVVTVDELPRENVEAAAEETDADGMRVVYSEVPDCGLIEAALYLDASHVPAEDLHRYQLGTELYGFVDTAVRSYADMTAAAARYGVSVSAETLKLANSDEYRPVLRFSFICLPEDMEAAFDFIAELCFTSDYSDTGRINYILNNDVLYEKIMAGYNGHTIAGELANAILFPDCTYLHYLNGLPYLMYQEELLSNDQEALLSELAEVKRVMQTLLNRQNFVMTVVGSRESIDRAVELGSRFYQELCDENRDTVNYQELLPALPSRIAVLLNEDAYHHEFVVRLKDAGVEPDGRYLALDRLTRDLVLTPVMRYRNGVYSPSNSTGEKSTGILAYRDPSMTRTAEEVLPSLRAAVCGQNITREMLNGYIVNAYTNLALPVGPFTRASIAVEDVLTGENTFTKKTAKMETLCAMQPEDIPAMTVIYDALYEKGVQVTAGSSVGILEHADDFDMIIDWYIKY